MSLSPPRLKLILPGGYVDESGGLHREVELAPLSGREEEFLAEGRSPASAALVTLLLARCVDRIGSIRPVSEDTVRRLLLADRQYLLLKLREITFGDRVQATVKCSRADCGQKLDIDFSLDDIPIHEAAMNGPLYTLELSADAAFNGDQGETYREITFRLPNGDDQERITPLIPRNAAEASAMLLERCIQRIGPLTHPGPALIRRLSPLARREIERQMDAVAPKVDLMLAANCPECGCEFTVPFDLQAFFLAELRTSRDLLYREVHTLAYHYHWSEHRIMAMPREKRRRYIAVLAEELERLNHAV